jgi:hypothetical protein
MSALAPNGTDTGRLAQHDWRGQSAERADYLFDKIGLAPFQPATVLSATHAIQRIVRADHGYAVATFGTGARHATVSGEAVGCFIAASPRAR